MDERKAQFRVGVMVLSAFLVMGILVALFGGLPKMSRGTDTIRVWVLVAPAVTAHTPVQKSGVRIGRVERVQLVEGLSERQRRANFEAYFKQVHEPGLKDAEGKQKEEFKAKKRAEYSRGVIITAEIEKGYTLYRDEVCKVSTSLLGDPVLEIEQRPRQSNKVEPEEPVKEAGAPEGDTTEKKATYNRLISQAKAGSAEPEKPAYSHGGRRAEAIADGGWIEGVYDGGPTQVIDELYRQVTKTSETLTRAGSQVEDAFRNIKETLDEDTRDNIQAAFANINEILDEETRDNIQEAAKAMRNILGKEETQDELAKAIGQLPTTLNNMNKALARFVEPRPSGQPAPVDQMINVIDAVDETLDKFTKRPAPDKLAPVDQLVVTIDRFQQIMDQINLFAQRLNRQDSALGQLVNDPQTAEDIRQVVKNLNELSWRLKPIVEDVRVFTNKIARHPERLGVRGALQRYPGIK